MSRIGKMPVIIPEGVTVNISDSAVEVLGPKGTLTEPVLANFVVEQKENRLEISPISEDTVEGKFWGLQRTLIANLMVGVTEGFTKSLEVNGVGFRVNLQGNKLVLNLGFSHPIEYTAPENIELKVEQNIITVSGADKQMVGEVAATIRSYKKPEPYKGKGIKYVGEHIRRKAGKTAAKAGA